MTVFEPTAVVIGVLTYRRPASLRRALGGIAALTVPDGVEVRVIVVENDAGESARPTIEDLRSCGFPFELDYSVEPRRGIPQARNRVIELARSRPFDWLGFVDDDDVPDPQWLEALLAMQRRTNADVVMGPLLATYEPGGSQWIIDGDLVALEQFRDGEPFPFFHAHTSGTIVRASRLPTDRQVFDERLALTGGEDRLLFTHIARAGGTFIWAGDAVLREIVPATRARLGWLIRRWYRIGITRSLIMVYLEQPRWHRRARRALGGLVMAGRGFGQMAIGAFRGRVAMARGLRLMLIGIGSSLGAIGVEFKEYKATHGS